MTYEIKKQTATNDNSSRTFAIWPSETSSPNDYWETQSRSPEAALEHFVHHNLSLFSETFNEDEPDIHDFCVHDLKNDFLTNFRLALKVNIKLEAKQ